MNALKFSNNTRCCSSCRVVRAFETTISRHTNTAGILHISCGLSEESAGLLATYCSALHKTQHNHVLEVSLTIVVSISATYLASMTGPTDQHDSFTEPLLRLGSSSIGLIYRRPRTPGYRRAFQVVVVPLLAGFCQSRAGSLRPGQTAGAVSRSRMGRRRETLAAQRRGAGGQPARLGARAAPRQPLGVAAAEIDSR